MNSKKSYYSGIIILLLIIIYLMLAYKVNNRNDIFLVIVGLLVFVIGFLSMYGTIQSFKGLKEPNTVYKVVGMIINGSVFLLFSYIILANVGDVIKLFS
ncbi:hypothetical protein WH52_06560 [Tenacibaculum holothuriorum]|uniref:Uncharacterized protein n=1 Tax=Tenacibaculum holothuriorum TaxID=1635173 RepID=A0A1Y2PD55_9FLAO|nr:hypothetical protein [Tenacibaculum holothuriorum]OSY88416.1 hypothetical protein WH52_06560 [Tenacibaculum holothuriorum]